MRGNLDQRDLLSDRHAADAERFAPAYAIDEHIADSSTRTVVIM